MVDGLTFWSEFFRIHAELATPSVVEAMTFGSSVRFIPETIEGDTHRPALLDNGVRWLLDGSGECA